MRGFRRVHKRVEYTEGLMFSSLKIWEIVNIGERPGEWVSREKQWSYRRCEMGVVPMWDVGLTGLSNYCLTYLIYIYIYIKYLVMLSCTVAKIQKRTPRLHFPKCLHALCLESPSSPFYGHCFEQIQKKNFWIILVLLSEGKKNQ